jgi:hypothetical protein
MKYLLFVLTFAGACAHTPLATESAAAAIRGAEEAGASKIPTAALHVQLAQEALDEAAVLARQGAHDEATSLLSRAEADAELAVALSRAESARLAASEAQQLLESTKSTDTDTL